VRSGKDLQPLMEIELRCISRACSVVASAGPRVRKAFRPRRT
jgi:hypothetical protein